MSLVYTGADRPTELDASPLVSVNFHLFQPCNLRCRFCFATFREVKGRLSTPDAMRLLHALRAAGTQKINFAGGEPTLHPDIGPIVAMARQLGFTVSLITNGARLEHLLDTQASDLDWVGLSVDSADEGVQAELGRGRGGHVARSLELAARVRACGLRSKLNTVVTALNWQEDMRLFAQLMRPDRWKVFQVLPVDGQNDGAVEPLLISRAQFQAFIDRHASLATVGLAPVVEDNDAMTGSYLMIDPLGRFFCNTAGRHTYSESILEVGVEAAAAQVGFRFDKLVARDGVYAW